MPEPENSGSLKADIAFLGCSRVYSAREFTYANLRAKRLKVVTADPGAG